MPGLEIMLKKYFVHLLSLSSCLLLYVPNATGAELDKLLFSSTRSPARQLHKEQPPQQRLSSASRTSSSPPMEIVDDEGAHTSQKAKAKSTAVDEQSFVPECFPYHWHYLSLALGLKDTYHMNTYTDRFGIRRFYDAEVFPIPNINTTSKYKNIVDTPTKEWNRQRLALIEAYKKANTKFLRAKERLEKAKKAALEAAARSAKEKAKQAPAPADSSTTPTAALQESVIVTTATVKDITSTVASPAATQSPLDEQVQVLQKKFDAAQTALEQLKNKLVSLHWINKEPHNRDSDDKTRLVPMSISDIELKFVYPPDSLKLDAPLGKHLVDLRSQADKKPIKSFTISDPYDIRIGIYVLERMLMVAGSEGYLQRQNTILNAAMRLFEEDYRSKTSGYDRASLTNWWYYQQTLKTIQLEKLVPRFPNLLISIRSQQRPVVTDAEQALVLAHIDRDALGERLRTKFLDNIVFYQETVIDSEDVDRHDEQIDKQFGQLSKDQPKPIVVSATKAASTVDSKSSGVVTASFPRLSVVLKGADEAKEEVYKPTQFTERNGIRRTFANPVETQFLKVVKRQAIVETKDEGQPSAEPVRKVVEFNLPKNLKMADEYRSPDSMRWHKLHWVNVMKDLQSNHSLLKKLYSPQQIREQFEDYSALLSRYGEALDTSVRLLMPEREAYRTWTQTGSLNPYNLLFIDSPADQTAAHPLTDALVLQGFNITNRDLIRRRLLPSGWVAVIQHYKTVDVSNNRLTTEPTIPFGQNLTSLNISRNPGFNSLDPLRSILTRLSTLKAAQNNLTSLSPLNVVGQNALLSDLDISGNQIDSLAPLTLLPLLTTLDVSLNPLTTLRDLEGSPILHTLTADMLVLPVRATQTWKDFFPTLPYLQELNFRNNPSVALFSPSAKAISRRDVQTAEGVIQEKFAQLRTLRLTSKKWENVDKIDLEKLVISDRSKH